MNKQVSLSLLNGHLMLVSEQLKTLFLRIPKTGSTTAVFYLLDSGLISDQDLYGNKTAKKAKRIVSQASANMGGIAIKDEAAISNNSHRRHKDLILDYPFLKDYESIAVVRNPLTRIVSAALMLQRDSGIEALNRNIDFLLRHRTILSVPQFEFIGESTTLWTTENLTETIESYVLEKGGIIREQWRCRENKSCDYLSMLSDTNKDRIHEMYAKDFDLWQSAINNATS